MKGRYVKVQGIRRGTGYGYSLYEMKVYGGEEHQAGLSDVHLIRLTPATPKAGSSTATPTGVD